MPELAFSNANARADQAQLATIDLGAITGAPVRREPYTYFTGANFLRANAIEAVERDFPKLQDAGFLTLPELHPEGAFQDFLAELQGEAVAAAMSNALGFDLRARPRLVTVMRLCPKRAGRIHTDGKAKLATLLVYFNRAWPAGHAGAIRVLRGPDDFEAYTSEIPPLMGNFFGFLRSDQSWHGHLPFEGERRVVQITWLESEAAMDRKQRNNALAQFLKALGPKPKR